MRTLRIYFDGAANNLIQPVYMGIGVAVYENDEYSKELSTAKFVGVGTSNVAEYHAVIEAIEIALDYVAKHPRTKVSIYGDSQLIIYQILGNWEVKKSHLRTLHAQASNLLMQLGDNLHKLEWVRREYNQEADKLSKIGLHKALN